MQRVIIDRANQGLSPGFPDGEDCAWLDDVSWTTVDTPDPIPPVASDDDVAAALTGTADADSGAFFMRVRVKQ